VKARPDPSDGAVGNSCIVAYGARSPARSAAEGHAQILQLRSSQWNHHANTRETLITKEMVC
jgi:hypothetical protein